MILAALIVLACVAAQAAAAPLAFTVRGHSMEPAIRDGHVVQVEPVPASEIRVGDVVVFWTGTGYVVHRVREIRRGRLWTKGDANARRDTFWVMPDKVVGRVISSP